MSPSFNQPANLALNRLALQSSTSPWSSSPVPEEDAKGANDGHASGEMGFHTAAEPGPWWQVDLGDDFLVRKVVLYNRQHCAHRLRHFSLLKSLDGIEWKVFFRKIDGAVFGAADALPYVAHIPSDQLARFVRVRLDGYDCLHFSECQVFGERPDAATRERVMKEEALDERARRAIPEGRNGHLTEIGGFTVFVDTSNYAADIIHALDHGYYEGQERHLVTELVRPGDRIIEAGTAIGVVSMVASVIVGTDNVLTFDANPDIVADARHNFRRNGLGGIRSRVGVLTSRSSMASPDETVSFYIDQAYWASRLDASPNTPGIIKTVQIPAFCLEDQIRSHSASVLICDIEGGEVALLAPADLSGIRIIIMETHYWAAGEAATDAMIRKLVMDGFNIHLGYSRDQVLVLRR